MRSKYLLRNLAFLTISWCVSIACLILVKAETSLYENGSSDNKLIIAIEQDALNQPNVREYWSQIIDNTRRILIDNGADIRDYRRDGYIGIESNIHLESLSKLNHLMGKADYSFYQRFDIRRWQGKYVLDAYTTSEHILRQIQGITGLSESEILLVQSPIRIKITLPGSLISSNSFQYGSSDPYEWVVNWWEINEFIFQAESEVNLIPPNIISPSNASRISEGNQVEIRGSGEPGAELTIAGRINGETIPLGQTIVDANGNWSLMASFEKEGLYRIQAIERVPNREAKSNEIEIFYKRIPPILLIPGFYACTKGLTGGNIIWDSVVNKIWAEKLNQTGLFAAAWDIYSETISFLESGEYKINKNLFVACYDWMSSLPEEAKDVKKWIDKVYDEFKTPMVLITHSNGGIVARYYIQNNPREAREKIKTLIMIAPPNQGVALAYYGWEGGEFEEIIGEEKIKKLLGFTLLLRCAYFPWLHPAKKNEIIFDCLRKKLPEKKLTDSSKDENIISIGWLIPTYPFLNLNGAMQLYRPFAPLSRLNSPSMVNKLLEGVQEGIYIISGDKGKNTIFSLTVTQEQNGKLWQNGRPNQQEKDRGDGTVAWLSTRIPNLDHPKVKYIDISDADHGVEILRKSNPQISTVLQEEFDFSQPERVFDSYYLVWVGSPVMPMITDPTGKKLGILPNGEKIFEIQSGLIGMTEDPKGQKILFIPSPRLGAYSLEINAIDDGDFSVYAITSYDEKPLIADHGTVRVGDKKEYRSLLKPTIIVLNNKWTLYVLCCASFSFLILVGLIVWSNRKRRRKYSGYDELEPMDIFGGKARNDHDDFLL